MSAGPSVSVINVTITQQKSNKEESSRVERGQSTVEAALPPVNIIMSLHISDFNQRVSISTQDKMFSAYSKNKIVQVSHTSQFLEQADNI